MGDFEKHDKVKELLKKHVNGNNVDDFISIKKYIAYLEDELDKQEKVQHDMFIELCKYKKALDKACKQMENCICAITRDGRYWTSKDWKEWCLKDE